jgi:saccharopine dehydrogenase-like NADP-dependent oxidoreductase
MTQRILIIGGGGRIGQAVVRDLHRCTTARLTLGGRTPARLERVADAFGPRVDCVAVDLERATIHELQRLVTGVDLAVQCVGPFRTQPPTLLAACIAAGVNYVDVCDDRRATQWRLGLHDAARAAGVVALIDTGTFPGIDNVLVAEALGRHPKADHVDLRFVCAGSGGGGFGVLQTTFLAVSQPYREWRGGRWTRVPSYRERTIVDFGPPLGCRPVYTFEVPEIWSLAQTFPQLKTVTSKFGSIPELWNWATVGLTMLPGHLRTDGAWLDLSAKFMLPWVHKVDAWVGEALGIRIDVSAPDGSGEAIQFYAPSTTQAVGWATGAAASMVLTGEIAEPGVLLPETHIPTQRYLEQLVNRGARIQRKTRV